MNADEIRALLGEPSPSVKSQVDEAIAHTLEVLRTKLPPEIADKLPPTPVVVFDLKGAVAGQAWLGQNKVRLNLALLNNPAYTEDMLNQTVPHEVAHLVTYRIWPTAKAHGRQWAYIMNLLGKPAKRCHQYEVEPARKHARPHAYQCNCRVHMVTNVLHTRIQSGKQYKCRYCGGRLH
jgi:SprT protein